MTKRVHHCRLCLSTEHHATTCEIEIGREESRMGRDQRYRHRQRQRLSDVACVICGALLTMAQLKERRRSNAPPACGREHAQQIRNQARR